MPQTPPEPPDKGHIFDTSAGEDTLKPLNATAIPKTSGQIAVAITTDEDSRDDNKGGGPRITAAGRGALARKILDLAYANGIKVREDKDLAELLAKIELDSPVPSEALLAVAEILAYVYKANGHPDPFNAIFDETDDKEGTHDTGEAGA